MSNNKKMTKEEALEKIASLQEIIIIRIAELCNNEKAKSYFTNPILWNIAKKFLFKWFKVSLEVP